MSDNSVISTRVRLARNLKDFPFPCKLSPDGMEKVIEKVRSAVKNSNSSIASDFKFIKMSDLTEAQCVSLVERRIVSPEFISNTEGRALLVNSDESLSIMINEEDHIRIQAITKGLALEQTYDLVDRPDAEPDVYKRAAVSPTILPTARIIPARIPGIALGRIILIIVLSLPAPSP